MHTPAFIPNTKHAFISARPQTYTWNHMRRVEFVLWKHGLLRFPDIAPAVEVEFGVQIHQNEVTRALKALAEEDTVYSPHRGLHGHNAPNPRPDIAPGALVDLPQIAPLPYIVG
jgi:hypothetical protein